MSRTVLLSGKHFVVSVDEGEKIVVIKRTKAPYTSIEEVRQTNLARFAALREYGGKRYRLLLDARDGPLRNDPEFEAETREARTTMVREFARTAILVKTAIGMLQLQRLNRGQSDESMRVFEDDEDAALAFLNDLPPLLLTRG